MENNLAYFLGGNENGSIKEIEEIETRLNFHGVYYLRRGELKTEKYGRVQIYTVEGMSREEEQWLIKEIRTK